MMTATQSLNAFETIKHTGTKTGTEFWYARELQTVLGYKEWRNFITVIEKAKEACKASNIGLSDHFVDVNKMVSLGSGSERKLDDIAMTRYACYLVVQNADPSKEIIAKAQTYFAIQTRRQELNDQFQQLSEDERRLNLRDEMKVHNKQLADAANQAGINHGKDYANFQNHGYRGLYGGLDAKDIALRKDLKPKDKILDHMGSSELAANLFRATQTEDKLRREEITNKKAANSTHYEVGKKVRQTIEDLGGTMPENLPTPDKSIQQLQKEQQKVLRNKKNTDE